MTGYLALVLAAVAAHVLTGVFWVGSTFVLARFGPQTGGLRMRRVQLLAAVVSVLFGVWLWLGRRGEWSAIQGHVMAVGAVAAIAAAGVQSGLGLVASRQLEGPDDAGARRRLRRIDWAASVLLGICVIAMVLPRYL